MAQDVHGFGPAGGGFSHRLFLQEKQPVGDAAQLTWVVVHEEEGVRLGVEFPGSEAEADLLEPTASKGALHQFSLRVEADVPALDLIPVGPGGTPLAAVCARYLVGADRFEPRPAPTVTVPEEPFDEHADMEARLAGAGRSRMCALCSELFSAAEGTHLGYLGAGEADALRLMLPVVDAQTFVCHACRERRLGTKERVLGGMGRAQAVGFVLARVALRGYLAALLVRFQLGVTGGGATMVAGFLGAFLPLELLPLLAIELARGALGMLAILLAPILLVALFFFHPDQTLRVMTGDVGLLLRILGLTSQNLLNEVVVVRGFQGSMVAAGLAFAAGGGDAKALTAFGEALRARVRALLARSESQAP